MRIVVAHHDPAACERWRAALTQALPEAHVEIWRAGAPSADYAVAWAAPPSPFFEEQRALKALFSTGAGVEKLVAAPTLPTDLPIIRLEDAGMGLQMAHYCVRAALNWIGHADAYAEQQGDRIWRRLPAQDLAEWPIGVFGLGVLGRRVAAAFVGLGFTVNGYARSLHSDPDIACFCESGGAGGFDAFLEATRVLIILAPLTPATRNRFDRATLAQLRPGSYVINVARGGLLDEDALLALLESGRLAGAALDVFREEPLPREHPFWTHPKIRITPHVSAWTIIGPSARQIAEKIQKLERGETVGGVVDRARGY